jgi:hypothetical protein
MVTVNSPGDTLNPANDQLSRLNRLEQEFDKLKSLLEKENRGLHGWAKRWGAVLALIVAFVAVPRGIVDLYQLFWSQPRTELYAGNDVVFGYNPVQKTVSLILSFGVENSGSKDDFLNDWGASLKNTSVTTSKTLPFSSKDIECKSQGSMVQRPYPLHTLTPIQMSCTLENTDLDPFKESGTYQIKMNVIGAASQKQTVVYCFDLGGKLITEVIGSTSPETKTILKNPACEASPGS